MITKKHFKEIALILKKFNASDGFIEAFCSFLKTVNPNFDKDKFIKAIKE